MAAPATQYDGRIQRVSERMSNAASYNRVAEELFADGKINRGRLLVWQKFSMGVRQHLPPDQQDELNHFYYQWWNVLNEKHVLNNDLLKSMKVEWDCTC